MSHIPYRQENSPPKVLIQIGTFQVFINGEHYCSFAHRVEDTNNEYKFLRIDGEIEITGVEVSH
jgi:hypothetical protein